MQLRHHALRQVSDFLAGADVGFGKKAFCLRTIESWMHASHIFDHLRDLDPARQYGDIGDEADIAHELIARGPRIPSQYLQLSRVGDKAEDGVERGSLAGAVGTDEPEDAALFYTEMDAIQRDGSTETLAEAASLYACHGFSASP